jgi:hypothetical protein
VRCGSLHEPSHDEDRSADELESLVLGEVCVVLGVQCGERQLSGEAARRDPGVVDRPRPPAEAGVCLLTPDPGGVEAGGEDDDAGEEGLETGATLWSPAVQVRPLGQLADGNKR